MQAMQYPKKNSSKTRLQGSKSPVTGVMLMQSKYGRDTHS